MRVSSCLIGWCVRLETPCGQCIATGIGTHHLQFVVVFSFGQVGYSSRLQDSFRASVASATHQQNTKLSLGGVLATGIIC